MTYGKPDADMARNAAQRARMDAENVARYVAMGLIKNRSDAAGKPARQED